MAENPNDLEDIVEEPELPKEDPDNSEEIENPETPEEPKEIPVADSILNSVKKLIGITEEDKSFDLDIMLNINATISVLYQLGVLKEIFTVTTEKDTYQDLIPEGTADVIHLIKMYFVYKTRLSFDSTTLSATVIDVIKEMIKETEWRLMTSFNPTETYK